MYALQGVPMTTLARSIPSIFQKWCAFRLPNPLKIHFSKKGIPRKKLSIPGDPGKTKPVKCIKPPPQNKRSWGGVGYPDPWILHLTYTHRSNNVFRGGPGESNSWRTVNAFFFPNLSPPLKYIFRGGWYLAIRYNEIYLTSFKHLKHIPHPCRLFRCSMNDGYNNSSSTCWHLSGPRLLSPIPTSQTTPMVVTQYAKWLWQSNLGNLGTVGLLPY